MLDWCIGFLGGVRKEAIAARLAEAGPTFGPLPEPGMTNRSLAGRDAPGA
jgi:hypothetical protein